MDSSADRGQPASPSLAALGPRVRRRRRSSRGSSACWAISTPEPARVLQRAAHDQWIVHADSVIGEHPDLAHAGGHQAHLGELFAFQAHGDRTDRVHVDQADLLAAVPDVVGDHRAVGHRVGVGHREDGGVAAQSGGRRTGFDVLGVLAARLAQVRVQIDEPGQQDLAGRFDDLGVRLGRSDPGADLGDLTVGDAARRRDRLRRRAVRP